MGKGWITGEKKRNQKTESINEKQKPNRDPNFADNCALRISFYMCKHVKI